MGFYCRWYGKKMENLAEWQQDACEENGQMCFYDDGRRCQDLLESEEENEELLG